MLGFRETESGPFPTAASYCCDRTPPTGGCCVSLYNEFACSHIIKVCWRRGKAVVSGGLNHHSPSFWLYVFTFRNGDESSFASVDAVGMLRKYFWDWVCAEVMALNAGCLNWVEVFGGTYGITARELDPLSH